MPAIDGPNARSQNVRRTVLGPEGTGNTGELKRVGNPKRTAEGASGSIDRTIAPHLAA